MPELSEHDKAQVENTLKDLRVMLKRATDGAPGTGAGKVESLKARIEHYEAQLKPAKEAKK